MYGSRRVARLHDRIALRDVDRAARAFAVLVLAIAAIAAVAGNGLRAVVFAGLAALAAYVVLSNRKVNRLVMWALAAESDDPVATLTMCERIYAMPLADVRAITTWLSGGCVGDPPYALERLRDR